jgi:Stress responsive A/B Barrel Domain
VTAWHAKRRGVHPLVLFRLKPGVTHQELETFVGLTKGLVGKIPGLISFETGRALAQTIHRAKGFDFAICALLESPEYIQACGASLAVDEPNADLTSEMFDRSTLTTRPI